MKMSTELLSTDRYRIHQEPLGSGRLSLVSQIHRSSGFPHSVCGYVQNYCHISYRYNKKIVLKLFKWKGDDLNDRWKGEGFCDNSNL